LRLPIEHPRGAANDLCRVRQLERELTYHPERFIDAAAEPARCERCSGSSAKGEIGEPRRSIEVKRHWIATPKTPDNAAVRHSAISSANRALQPWVADRREKMRDEIEHLGRQARGEAILGSREYSFCLYPESLLRDFLATP
jgi:hypothetical protein